MKSHIVNGLRQIATMVAPPSSLRTSCISSRGVMLCTLVHGPTMATPNYDIKEIPIPMLSSVLFNLEIYLSACYLDWMVSPLYKKDSL